MTNDPAAAQTRIPIPVTTSPAARRVVKLRRPTVGANPCESLEAEIARIVVEGAGAWGEYRDAKRMLMSMLPQGEIGKATKAGATMEEVKRLLEGGAAALERMAERGGGGGVDHQLQQSHEGKKQEEKNEEIEQVKKVRCGEMQEEPEPEGMFKGWNKRGVASEGQPQILSEEHEEAARAHSEIAQVTPGSEVVMQLREEEAHSAPLEEPTQDIATVAPCHPVSADPPLGLDKSDPELLVDQSPSEIISQALAIAMEENFENFEAVEGPEGSMVMVEGSMVMVDATNMMDQLPCDEHLALDAPLVETNGGVIQQADIDEGREFPAQKPVKNPEERTQTPEQKEDVETTPQGATKSQEAEHQFKNIQDHSEDETYFPNFIHAHGVFPKKESDYCSTVFSAESPTADSTIFPTAANVSHAPSVDSDDDSAAGVRLVENGLGGLAGGRGDTEVDGNFPNAQDGLGGFEVTNVDPVLLKEMELEIKAPAPTVLHIPTVPAQSTDGSRRVNDGPRRNTISSWRFSLEFAAHFLFLAACFIIGNIEKFIANGRMIKPPYSTLHIDVLDKRIMAEAAILFLVNKYQLQEFVLQLSTSWPVRKIGSTLKWLAVALFSCLVLVLRLLRRMGAHATKVFTFVQATKLAEDQLRELAEGTDYEPALRAVEKFNRGVDDGVNWATHRATDLMMGYWPRDEVTVVANTTRELEKNLGLNMLGPPPPIFGVGKPLPIERGTYDKGKLVRGNTTKADNVGLFLLGVFVWGPGGRKLRQKAWAALVSA